jgi:hypothetical protein
MTNPVGIYINKIPSGMFPPLAVHVGALEGVTINYGRPDVTSQPNASTASVTILKDSTLGDFDDDLSYFDLGNFVTIEATFSGIPYTRFQGQITDVTVDEYFITFLAADDLYSALGRFKLTKTGDVDLTGGRIQETLQYALPAAGFPVPPYDVDAGTVYLYAADATTQNALAYLQEVTNSEPSGVFFRDILTGDLRFTDSEARRQQIALDPYQSYSDTEVLDVWSIRKTSQEKINRARISNDIDTVTYEDATDITDNGIYEYSFTSLISTSDDMLTLARRIVVNRARPEFTFSAIQIELSTMTLARQEAIISTLRNGQLTQLPTFGAFNVDGLDFFVEGYSERIGQEFWSITLNLSDARLTRPPQRWSDIVSGVLWNAAAIDPYTWNDLLREYI